MIEFQPHAVAYLDILGFSKFVEDAEKELDKSKQLCKLFNEIIPREILPDGKNSNYPEYFCMKCLSISDSFIVSAPISKDPTHPALVVVSMKAIQIAHALLDMGFLVRGAIAVGNVYRTDSNILGTAYQEAVDGEKNAVNPQIVLTESAEKNLDEFNGKSEFNKYAIFGKNELGKIILNAIHPEPSYLPDTQGDVNEYFRKYRDAILENLSHEDQKARAKWLWFAGLFNANVQYFSTLNKSLTIDQELPKITINYLNPPTPPEDNFKWAMPFVAQGVPVKINTGLIKPE